MQGVKQGMKGKGLIMRPTGWSEETHVFSKMTWGGVMDVSALTGASRVDTDKGWSLTGLDGLLAKGCEIL